MFPFHRDQATAGGPSKSLDMAQSNVSADASAEFLHVRSGGNAWPVSSRALFPELCSAPVDGPDALLSQRLIEILKLLHDDTESVLHRSIDGRT
jgi:hypothetical protein